MIKPLQDHVYDVGVDVFGITAMQDGKERLLRFLEEAIELCRTGGLTPQEIANVVMWEMTRPVEKEIRKELGGAGVTLYAVAEAFGHLLDQCVVIEIERVAANKDKIREKSLAKPDHVHAVRGVGQ